MTPNEQNKTIAEYCGWKHRDGGMWYNPGGSTVGEELMPNYHSDLNAMHKAEKKLAQQENAWKYQRGYYLRLREQVIASMPTMLWDEVAWIDFNILRATSQQRAEAFLRTIGKWKE
jgi:hypothetical protein